METKTGTEAVLAQIEALAPAVAAAYEAQQAAVAAENAAEAAVLEHAIALARPALRALSSRIAITYRSWWVGTTHQEDEHTYHPTLRGLCISDATLGPSRHSPTRDENRGSFVGTELFVAPDGLLYTLSYEGSWSRWQGEGDSWTVPAGPVQVTPAQALKSFNLDALLALLHQAITQQATAKRPTKTASERAERLEAILKLVR